MDHKKGNTVSMIDVLGVIMVLFDYLEDVLVLEDTC
jgi:hypothetical protein